MNETTLPNPVDIATWPAAVVSVALIVAVLVLPTIITYLSNRRVRDLQTTGASATQIDDLRGLIVDLGSDTAQIKQVQAEQAGDLAHIKQVQDGQAGDISEIRKGQADDRERLDALEEATAPAGLVSLFRR